MKKVHLLQLLTVGFLMGVFSGLFAQEKPQTDHTYKPLTLKLNEDGSKYIRLMNWHQFWVTFTQNNPGTLDVNGKETKYTTDFALRRSRFLITAQVSPRFLILTHWGINNQSFNGGATSPSGPNSGANAGKKPQMFIHEATTEYQILKDKLYIGAGLHYWNGVSRLSSHSTASFMALDAPIFNWYNIEMTDQFARQFGVYAKGQLGRFDYRLHLNKPFLAGIKTSELKTQPNAVNVYNENWAAGGYVNYMFFDKESNKLPYFSGSYLGSKKVFNLGAGFYRHPEATATRRDTASAIQLHNQICLSVDAFLDMPVNKATGTAISAYLVYYRYNFGPNYLRNIGILNLHSSGREGAAATGFGNAQPTIGTGNILYGQLGVQLPKFGNGQALMPYITATHKEFYALAGHSSQFGMGLNYLISGHNAKITLEYQSRPVYKLNAGSRVLDGYRGEVILQTQIFL
jgi:hypothetical protein